jgi:hypothetical protein
VTFHGKHSNNVTLLFCSDTFWREEYRGTKHIKEREIRREE